MQRPLNITFDCLKVGRFLDNFCTKMENFHHHTYIKLTLSIRNEMRSFYFCRSACPLEPKKIYSEVMDTYHDMVLTSLFLCVSVNSSVNTGGKGKGEGEGAKEVAGEDQWKGPRKANFAFPDG